MATVLCGLDRNPCLLDAVRQGTCMWPRQESNLDLELRKLLYYPLYYEACYELRNITSKKLNSKGYTYLLSIRSFGNSYTIPVRTPARKIILAGRSAGRALYYEAIYFTS